jgi:glucose/arabinose dehydrogenase
MQVMSPKSPPPNGPNGVSSGPVVLVLAALTLAMAWHWFPVSIAVAPSSARSAKDVEAIAARLTPPQGFTVNAYAIGLGQARVMVLTSKGDIILSSPPHRVLLVKADSDGDGRSDGVETLIETLEKPSGLFLDGNQLYIAEDSRVLRVGFNAETGKIAGTPGTILPDLPRNGMHWTRTIKKGPDGYFYVSIGASCNVCVETNPWRAGIIRFKPGEKAELYASGLRNTVGFDWQPGTNALYGVDNGRDWLGDNLPPEEVNRIVEGGFYGWPYLYGDNQPDPDYGKEARDRTNHALPPVYGLPAHVAPLSILFLRHAKLAKFGDAALVAEHGSWNRSQKIGYQVVALHWWEGQITEEPFLTGFLKGEGDVLGRPVDIVELPDGTIFVSDDYNGVIWRVAPSP